METGAQPGFCQGRGLKMGKNCDVIFMTYLSDVIWLRHLNYVTTDIFEVLLICWSEHRTNHSTSDHHDAKNSKISNIDTKLVS